MIHEPPRERETGGAHIVPLGLLAVVQLPGVYRLSALIDGVSLEMARKKKEAASPWRRARHVWVYTCWYYFRREDRNRREILEAHAICRMRRARPAIVRTLCVYSHVGLLFLVKLDRTHHRVGGSR